MTNPEDHSLPPQNPADQEAPVSSEETQSGSEVYEASPTGPDSVVPDPLVPDRASEVSKDQPATTPANPPLVEPAVTEAEPTVEELEASREAVDAAVISDSHAHTRRSFLVAAGGAAAGYGLYRWIDHSAGDMRQPVPLRRAFQTNAALSRTLFEERALAPTYPLHRAEVLRVNGIYGLKQELVPTSWRLQLVGTREPEQDSRFSQSN